MTGDGASHAGDSGAGSAGRDPAGAGGGRELPAGDFSAWLARMREALRSGAGTDVPCGDCCACCSTAHFVHVGPDETGTLDRVPRELQFPAPGLPAGHVVLPYDARGRCPMLAEDGTCTIYDHRPRTCRVYDCRVFAAAGIDADTDAITAQSCRWRFTYPASEDGEQHEAVREAARFLRDHAAAFPADAAPDGPRLAVLAVASCHLFLGRERLERGEVRPPDAELVAGHRTGPAESVALSRPAPAVCCRGGHHLDQYAPRRPSGSARRRRSGAPRR